MSAQIYPFVKTDHLYFTSGTMNQYHVPIYQADSVTHCTTDRTLFLTDSRMFSETPVISGAPTGRQSFEVMRFTVMDLQLKHALHNTRDRWRLRRIYGLNTLEHAFDLHTFIFGKLLQTMMSSTIATDLNKHRTLSFHNGLQHLSGPGRHEFHALDITIEPEERDFDIAVPWIWTVRMGAGLFDSRIMDSFLLISDLEFNAREQPAS